jgi:hypothetical protein
LFVFSSYHFYKVYLLRPKDEARDHKCLKWFFGSFSIE